MLVSVIIPTYKRALNLKRALNSVLSQTYKNIEIIVIDDNDEKSSYRYSTEIIMNEYKKYDNIFYIKHKKNHNGAVARNNGIKKAKGNFIAFLDDDDEFLPRKITEQVNYLIKNQLFDGCYCLSNKIRNKKVFYTTSYDKEGDPSIDILSLKSEIYTPSLLIKRSALIKINLFNESFRRHQDYDLLLRYLEYYKIGCLGKPLVNIYVDDTTNHLKTEELELLKSFFLKTFKFKIDKYDQLTQKLIYQEHYFELFYVSLKEFKIKKIFFYLYKSKPSIKFFLSKKDKIISVLSKIFRSKF